MREGRTGRGAHIDLRPGAGGKFPVSGNKIGVQMSFENVADGESVFFGGLQIEIHITLGIDHHRFAFRAHHVRSVSQAAEIELFEVHSRLLR